MLLDLRVQGMTAPSGMRRLMLYKLQEEALNKKQETPPEPRVVVQIRKAAPKVSKPAGHFTKVSQVERIQSVVVPFIRTPIVEEKTAYDELAKLESLPVPIVTSFSVATVNTVVKLSAVRRKNRRKKKALALLLMAA